MPGTPRYYGPKEEETGVAPGVGPLITDDEAYYFNCVQRGHQNTLEGSALVCGMAIISWGFPIISGFAFALWVFSRVLYLLAYSRGHGSRHAAVPYYLVSVLTLCATTLATGIYIFMGKTPY